MFLFKKVFNKIMSFYEKRIVDKQGGEKSSIYLRKIVLERNRVDVGMHSYGGCFRNEFNVGGEVKIGRYCSFGPNVRYFGANHPMDYASMSPYFYQKSWGDTQVKDIERFKLEVGHDCWIGYGTIITCNCHKIGNGAVIGAGAVVTKDIEPYSIVAGNPAKHLRYRFDEETRELLEQSQWFEMEPENLLKYYELINSPREFAEAVIELRRR